MDSGCPRNLVSLWEFPPILVANPAVTRKGVQLVSGASREQTYIEVLLCDCPAKTWKSDISQIHV